MLPCIRQRQPHNRTGTIQGYLVHHTDPLEVYEEIPIDITFKHVVKDPATSSEPEYWTFEDLDITVFSTSSAFRKFDFGESVSNALLRPRLEVEGVYYRTVAEAVAGLYSRPAIIEKAWQSTF